MPIISELLVPFGMDNEKQLWTPVSAEKGKAYFCPSCQTRLILRQGEIKIWHFAHKPSETCGKETIIHETAKLLVKDAVLEWKTGKRAQPVFHRHCPVCNTVTVQPLPEKVDDAITEHRLIDGSIVDVALMFNGIPQAAIEIRVTHAVNETKANRLPIPFAELKGEDVLENPIVWKPITDKLKPFVCEECKRRKAMALKEKQELCRKFLSKARNIAKATEIKLSTQYYYRYSPYVCRHCKREILVFIWPGQPFRISKIIPKPKSITKFIYTNRKGNKYIMWKNTCPYCGAIPFFYCSDLTNSSDGPFYGVDRYSIINTASSFRKDMLQTIDWHRDERIL